MVNWVHNQLKHDAISKKGFTLMELLVVIAIIAVLISVAAASYSTVQSRGRDSRRLSDMRAIQAGFEQYFAEHSSTYPTGDVNSCTFPGSEYLPGGAYPTDPKPSYTYRGQCNGTGSSYTYCAQLENTKYGNSNISTPPLGVPLGACAANCNYYCVTSVQ